MDALPPDPAAAETHPTQTPSTATSNELSTILFAAATTIAGLAFVISVVAIRLLTGRSELNFHPLLLSVIFDLLLLLVAGAVLARGHARRFFFALIASTLPSVLLATLFPASMQRLWNRNVRHHLWHRCFWTTILGSSQTLPDNEWRHQ